MDPLKPWKGKEIVDIEASGSATTILLTNGASLRIVFESDPYHRVVRYSWQYKEGEVLTCLHIGAIDNFIERRGIVHGI